MCRVPPFLLALAAMLAALVAAGEARAQGISADTPVGIELQTPTTATKVSDLDFGTILATGVDGTVRIDPVTNVLTTTGGAVAMGDPVSRAHFTTDRGFAFLYVQYDPTVTMNPVGGTGDPIDVTLEFAMTNSLFSFASGAGRIALVYGGEQNYYLGGSFDLPADQEPGAYEGTFEFIVDNP